MFNGSVEDTFDFVLTTLYAIKKDTDIIRTDKEWYEIKVETIAPMSKEMIKMAIFFYENKK